MRRAPVASALPGCPEFDAADGQAGHQQRDRERHEHPGEPRSSFDRGRCSSDRQPRGPPSGLRYGPCSDGSHVAIEQSPCRHCGRRFHHSAGARCRGRRRAHARNRPSPARVRREDLRRRRISRVGARRGAAFAAGHAHPLRPSERSPASKTATSAPVPTSRRAWRGVVDVRMWRSARSSRTGSSSQFGVHRCIFAWGQSRPARLSATAAATSGAAAAPPPTVGATAMSREMRSGCRAASAASERAPSEPPSPTACSDCAASITASASAACASSVRSSLIGSEMPVSRRS